LLSLQAPSKRLPDAIGGKQSENQAVDSPGRRRIFSSALGHFIHQSGQAPGIF